MPPPPPRPPPPQEFSAPSQGLPVGTPLNLTAAAVLTLPAATALKTRDRQTNAFTDPHPAPSQRPCLARLSPSGTPPRPPGFSPW